MIEVLEKKDENTSGLFVNGTIEKNNVKQVFELIEKNAGSHRKLKFYIKIGESGITDLSLDAVKEDIKFWFRHPVILPNFEQVALVPDKEWVKKIFDIECASIPTLEGESFSPDQKDEAIKWLKTDQREASRVNLTFSELVESSILKFLARSSKRISEAPYYLALSQAEFRSG